MTWPIVALPIETENDVVAVRQRARRVAELLGFDRQDQTRIATAVSEIARNAFGYAGGGRAEFAIEPADPQVFAIRISERASPICKTFWTASTGRRTEWAWPDRRPALDGSFPDRDRAG
jgi:anti-sigma regulatory factor (Ser/Thr protein kinase)